MLLNQRSQLIRQLANQFGFDDCRIAKAQRLDDDARRLEAWLNKGYHGTMDYMSNHVEKRVNPSELIPGAKSVIVLMFNYFPETEQDEHTPHIAKYAYGQDYHVVIREKLNAFLAAIQHQFGNVQGRGFVDSAPVLERAWAQRSGMGWIGRNGMLIHPQKGSFFFLATLIVDLELEADDPIAHDFCGTCTKCIEACPTSAILPNKELLASQCISYFTIELKSQELPEELSTVSSDWVFGCDICQDVCPWNRFSRPHDHPELAPLNEILNFNIHDWMSLSEERFNEVFASSPLKRTKWKGMQRNLKLLPKV
ncbi:MAG: tRNA epoxyqueuosine(34) reductase QueG [Bacteroidota bacterium]